MTLVLVLITLGIIFGAGYAPTLWLLERDAKPSRLVAIPVVGLATYIVVAHLFASQGFTGRTTSWICAGAIAVSLLSVPRDRRLSRQEIVQGLVPLGVCLAGLLLGAWPLLYQGYNSYFGFGNADAAFTLAAFEDLRDYGYQTGVTGSVTFWPNAQFAHLFGAGFLALQVAQLTGVSLLKLHDVVSSGLLFAAPASVFLFCTLVLKAERRWAILAMIVSASGCLVGYTFYLQSLGALTLMALLPAALALWSAALESGRRRLMLLSALLCTGACFGYYASLPLLAMLLGSAALTALAKGTTTWRTVSRATLVVAVLMLAAFPSLTLATVRRAIAEATSSRLQTSLTGQEVLLSFAFALTEELLPFFWGLSVPPLAWGSPMAPSEIGFWVVLGLAALLFAFLIASLIRPVLPVAVRVQAGLSLAALLYLLLRDNAYGVFKFAAWINPLMFSCLVIGVVFLLRKPQNCGWSWKACWVLAPLIAFNVFWTLRLGAGCLEDSRLAGKSMAGFKAGDFDALRSLSEAVGPDARILVAVPDPIVQRWAITYLRRRNLAAVPYLSFSPEEADPSEAVAAAGAERASYLLTWSAPNYDVTAFRETQPIWRNDKFQLVPMDAVRDFIVLGKGWYRLEGYSNSPFFWQRRFRWLRSNGEILLLKPSAQRLRLRLTVVAGYGRKEPDRVITLWVNGEKADEVAISGVGAFVSRPFQARGFLTRLRLSLPDNAQPEPKPWGLFNRWVPKDSRRLNLAVSRIEVVTEHEYQKLAPPCRLDLSDARAWEAPYLTGVYADRWIAGETRVLLRRCSEAEAIAVSGFLPGVPGAPVPLQLEMWVNGTHLEPQEVNRAGSFLVRFPLPPALRSAPNYEIRLRPSRSFVPGSGDSRPLSVLLERIEAPSGATAGVPDRRRSEGKLRCPSARSSNPASAGSRS